MSKNDLSLVRWAGRRQRSAVTLGQLVTLLELTAHESVAAINRSTASNAVNYRQKLDRLEKSLAVGRLTQKSGAVTQASALGRRVAAEVRLLLMELSRDPRSTGASPKWVFGAGESWLQGVVIPTLARWPIEPSAPQWEVANLQARELSSGLREGRIHFALMRSADHREEDGLDTIRTYPGVGHTLLLSGTPQFASCSEAVKWVVSNGHPLIQQGSSWTAFRAALGTVVGEDLIKGLMPTIVCETHPQAAGSIANGRGWSVVPSVVARSQNKTAIQVLAVAPTMPHDEMSLVVSSRVLDKLYGGNEAAEMLKREIGLTIAGLKK